MSNSTPVMGPAPTLPKSLAPSDPPMFDPQGDFQEYRKDVTRWVETIQAAANLGEDKMYKTVYATIGRQLYDRGLSREQKRVVDEAQRSKLIDYKQDDQLQAVKEIVQLIAVDPPIAVVTRLITSFTQVMQCKRRRSEDLKAFVARFRSLAADHLMHVGVSTSSQVSEVLAITLLNNAMLSEETLTNAILQLVALAESRKKVDADLKMSINSSTHQALLQMFDRLSDLVENDETVPQPTDNANTVRRKATDMVQGVSQLLDSNREQIDHLKTGSNETHTNDDMFSTTPRRRLNLDDAVTVIRNLAFTSKKMEKQYTKNDIENIATQRVDNLVENRIQRALAAFQKHSDNPGSASSRRPSDLSSRNRLSKGKQGSNKKRRTDIKDTYCYDCGKRDHIRGDSQCKEPSFQTKRLRKEKYAHQKPPDTNDKSFRQGSNPSQRSHL